MFFFLVISFASVDQLPLLHCEYHHFQKLMKINMLRRLQQCLFLETKITSSFIILSFIGLCCNPVVINTSIKWIGLLYGQPWRVPIKPFPSDEEIRLDYRSSIISPATSFVTVSIASTTSYSNEKHIIRR
jgi:hypothetical protein